MPTKSRWQDSPDGHLIRVSVGLGRPPGGGASGVSPEPSGGVPDKGTSRTSASPPLRAALSAAWAALLPMPRAAAPSAGLALPGAEGAAAGTCGNAMPCPFSRA
jgi:hypothetical protein